MMKTPWVLAMSLAVVALAVLSCEEGINDWNSSAKIVGNVYTDPTYQHGVEGVQVICESDPQAQHPYQGADRWFTTNGDGHFEGWVFLGSENGQYNYLADLRVAYFWHNKILDWKGGVTVGPGSVFTLPAVDTTLFVRDTTGMGGQ
jgi:hypothetical protein